MLCEHTLVVVVHVLMLLAFSSLPLFFILSPFLISPSLQLSSLLSPGVFGDPLPPLVPEDRVVFGVSASHPTTKTVAELGKTYSTVDTATIAREVIGEWE